MGRSDQGAYYCEADNGLGQAGKAELQVKKIQIQIQNTKYKYKYKYKYKMDKYKYKMDKKPRAGNNIILLYTTKTQEAPLVIYQKARSNNIILIHFQEATISYK